VLATGPGNPPEIPFLAGGSLQFSSVQFSSVQFRSDQIRSVWFGLVWFGLVQFGGLVWFGLVWFGSLPGQKASLHCLGVFVARTGHKPADFCLG
jgi:hypothetical protein